MRDRRIQKALKRAGLSQQQDRLESHDYCNVAQPTPQAAVDMLIEERKTAIRELTLQVKHGIPSARYGKYLKGPCKHTYIGVWTAQPTAAQ